MQWYHFEKTSSNRSCRDEEACACLYDGISKLIPIFYLFTYSNKKYIGLSEPPFKKRYANHLKSFNIEKYEKESELSKEVWKIKRNNKLPSITWKIIKRCAPFNKTNSKCNLCLNEKLEMR